MAIPHDRSYTAEHEWITNPAGPIARLGITEYAANQMGDVVYVDVPSVGSTVAAAQQCGEIESTKSVSDLFAPVSGTVHAINQAVVDNPELINTDSFGEGWLIEIAVEAAPAGLLDAAAYGELTGQTA